MYATGDIELMKGKKTKTRNPAISSCQSKSEVLNALLGFGRPGEASLGFYCCPDVLVHLFQNLGLEPWRKLVDKDPAKEVSQ